MDIKPGSTVTFKIVKQPTNTAARKTLVRLLSKDAKVKAENDRHRSIREKQYVPTQRGGRQWGGYFVKQHPVKGTPGESGTVLATVDVIRDLASVGRFVEIDAG